MPYRWRDPLPAFVSVLFTKNALRDACAPPVDGGNAAVCVDMGTMGVLTRALSCDEVHTVARRFLFWLHFSVTHSNMGGVFAGSRRFLALKLLH
jgi:hypothetical protein